jgi:hypothetical protein
MDAERFRPLLDDDDFPTRLSPWDRASASPVAGASSDDVDGTDAPTDGGGARKGRREEDDLPRIVMMMRLGNVAAAAMLIFGSVRRNYDALASLIPPTPTGVSFHRRGLPFRPLTPPPTPPRIARDYRMKPSRRRD